MLLPIIPTAAPNNICGYYGQKKKHKQSHQKVKNSRSSFASSRSLLLTVVGYCWCCCFCFWFIVDTANHGLMKSFKIGVGSSQLLLPSQQFYSTTGSISKSNNITSTTSTTKTKTTTTTTKKEIRDIFNQWNDALSTGDPSIISRLYYFDETTDINKGNNNNNNNKSLQFNSNQIK
mmetsp:Transcript_38516/g.41777  ORF Transcript_38516/g.41777 Transcript_38516/m.41777 type:complete len:176 (+) Transcript_38516:59-586(+)